MPSSKCFPVALERDVHPFSLVRSALDGLPLVLWRGADGRIHVWEDNCPHRSVRLSAGRNLGDCIEDVYHGWRFGLDGGVVRVPALLGKKLPTAKVRVLSASIASGLVWASTAEGTAVEPSVAMDDDEVLMRPLPFRAQAVSVEEACTGLDGLRVFVTPTGPNSATLYGFARRRAGAEDVETARRANALLSAIRRKVEAAV